MMSGEHHHASGECVLLRSPGLNTRARRQARVYYVSSYSPTHGGEQRKTAEDNLVVKAYTKRYLVARVTPTHMVMLANLETCIEPVQHN